MAFLPFLFSDSILVEKLDALLKSTDIIKNKTSFSPFVPLLAALLGGIIVIVSQYLDRLARKNNEKKKEILDAFTTSEMLLFKLKSLLKELSSFRSQVEYWYYAYLKEKESDKPEDELIKTYYNKCIGCSDNSLSCKAKIDETLSEYYSMVSKVYILKKLKPDISSIESFLITGELKEAEPIPIFTDSGTALKIMKKSNDSLFKEYLSSIKELVQLQASLLLIVNQKNNGNDSKKSS